MTTLYTVILSGSHDDEDVVLLETPADTSIAFAPTHMHTHTHNAASTLMAGPVPYDQIQPSSTDHLNRPSAGRALLPFGRGWYSGAKGRSMRKLRSGERNTKRLMEVGITTSKIFSSPKNTSSVPQRTLLLYPFIISLVD